MSASEAAPLLTPKQPPSPSKSEAKPTPEQTADALLELVGFGTYQRRLLVLATCWQAGGLLPQPHDHFRPNFAEFRLFVGLTFGCFGSGDVDLSVPRDRAAGHSVLIFQPFVAIVFGWIRAFLSTNSFQNRQDGADDR